MDPQNYCVISCLRALRCVATEFVTGFTCKLVEFETSTMILVLLYRFCESLDSLIGYKLCQKLVHEGHHLCVTTTARSEEKAEIRAAEHMSENANGLVRILEPEYEAGRTYSRMDR